MAGPNRRWLDRAVPRHSVVVKDIDHGMLDAVADGGGVLLDAEMREKHSSRAEMGGNHGIAGDLRVPGADAGKELLIALPAGRHETPGIPLPQRQGLGLAGLQLREIESLPFAERHFDQTRL